MCNYFNSMVLLGFGSLELPPLDLRLSDDVIMAVPLVLLHNHVSYCLSTLRSISFYFPIL